MPDYVVGIVFKGSDKLSKVFGKLDRNAKKFGNTATRSFSKASKSASMFKSVLSGTLASRAISAGTMALQQGISTVASEFVSFDHAITSAAAKFPTMVKRGTQAFEDLQKVAREVGGTTQFTAAQAGEGLNFLAMAGLNAEQAIALLPQVVDLATNANVDLGRATDIATDSLGAFNMNSKDTATLTANMAQMNNVLAKTVTSSNTSLEDMFEAVKDGGPILTTAGQSLETFATLVGTMANAGIKGSKAGTTLKNAILNLSKPAPKASKLLHTLGVQVQDSGGNFRDVIDVLEDFRVATKGMGTAQRAAAIDTVFGKRAVAGVTALLNSGGKALKAYRDDITGATTASADMAAEMRKSLLNRLETLKSTAIEAGFRILDAFKTKFPDALENATKAIKNFNVEPIINALKLIGGALKILWDYRGPIKTLFLILMGAKAVLALQKLVMGAKAAGLALKMMMLGNPIGVILTVLVALGVLVYEHWEDLRYFFVEIVWPAMKNAAQAVADWFVSTWNTIADWFLGIWDSIKSAAVTVWDFAKSAVQAYIGFYVGAFNWLVGFFVSMWEGVSTFFSGLWDGITSMIWSHVERIKKWIGWLVDGVSDFLGLADDANAAANARIEGPPGVSERGADGESAPGRTAPNASQVESQQSSIDFRGQIDINGAPEGTTVQSSTRGAPDLNMSLAGAQ